MHKFGQGADNDLFSLKDPQGELSKVKSLAGFIFT